ncbi:MAG: AAA family ATPase, partial [Verrucomicrobia bacterium]|nr:AAA family ATPase [Verrucomicrobiota bacterium]
DSAAEILSDKLWWTFQEDQLGKLVSRGAVDPLRFQMTFQGRDFHFSFGSEAEKSVTSIENHVLPRTSNSIFLPAKEILSLYSTILKSREDDQVFGFDDTYYDLARALRQAGSQGRQYEVFLQSRSALKDLLAGKVHYEPGKGRWNFNKGADWFPMGVTAEGVKKIAILETLLSNRYLSSDSVVFIDELESALHPSAISKMLDIVYLLAQQGLQFFIASHSYFVVKKLFLIAQEKGMSIPVISANANADGWAAADLRDAMPDNPIISESIRLYEEQVNLALQ